MILRDEMHADTLCSIAISYFIF